MSKETLAERASTLYSGDHFHLSVTGNEQRILFLEHPAVNRFSFPHELHR